MNSSGHHGTPTAQLTSARAVIRSEGVCSSHATCTTRIFYYDLHPRRRPGKCFSPPSCGPLGLSPCRRPGADSTRFCSAGLYGAFFIFSASLSSCHTPLLRGLILKIKENRALEQEKCKKTYQVNGDDGMSGEKAARGGSLEWRRDENRISRGDDGRVDEARLPVNLLGPRRKPGVRKEMRSPMPLQKNQVRVAFSRGEKPIYDAGHALYSHLLKVCKRKAAPKLGKQHQGGP